jgi:hypothetical protein
MTYRSFTTPHVLFDKLKQRFLAPPSIADAERKRIQARVIVSLKYWLETQSNDFDDLLIASMGSFINEDLMSANQPMALALKNILEKTVI